MPKEKPDLLGPRAAAYVSLIFFVVVYYIVAFLVLYQYGKRWFIPVWSFPIALLIVYALSVDSKRDCNAIYLYAIATGVLLLVLLGGMIALTIHCDMDRKDLIIICLGLWIIFSALGVILYDRTCSRFGPRA